MTRPPEMKKLLDEVLALQDEDGRGAELTEERAWDVLSGRGAFTAYEEHLLMTSPLARLTYAGAVDDLKVKRQAFRWRCEAAGVRTTTARKVLAASTADDVFIRDGRDFAVTVRPHPLSPGGWIITLTLREKFLQMIDADDVLALADHHGDIWLCGKVNCYGEIHSFEWPHPGTPADRMRRSDLELRIDKISKNKGDT
jgi:hypothetical protein